MNDQLNQVLSALWADDQTVHRVTAEEISPAIAPLFDDFLKHATREMKEGEGDRESLLKNLRSNALVWVTPGKKPGNTGWVIGANYLINSPHDAVAWQSRSVIIPLSFIAGGAVVKGGFFEAPNIRISLKDPKSIGCKAYFGGSHQDEHFCSLTIPLLETENRPKLIMLLDEIVKLGQAGKFELFDSFNQPRVLTWNWGAEITGSSK